MTFYVVLNDKLCTIHALKSLQQQQRFVFLTPEALKNFSTYRPSVVI